MTPIERYRDRLLAGLRDGQSPEDAVEACLRNMTRRELHEIARPALFMQARGIARDMARAVEREAFAKLEPATPHPTPTPGAPAPTPSAGEASTDSTPSGVTPSPQSSSAPEALRALLTEAFYLRDGTRCTWATATRAQHLDRAAWLRELAGGTLTTAQRHETVVALMDEHDVPTMGDLYDDPAAPTAVAA